MGAAAAYVDDQTVAYPAGHTVVVYNVDEKRQKFVTGTEGTAGITALALAPSRRFLAVAERGDRGLISVFDLKTLKKRKVLAGSGSTPASDAAGGSAGAPLSGRSAPSCVWLEFSADGQLLLAQGGAPDWVLTCWNWAKGKPVASIRAPIVLPTAPTMGTGSLASSMSTHHFNASTADITASGSPAPATSSAPVVSGCSFSNVDPGLVCVVGANLVRFFRLLESAFRPMPSPRIDNHNVLSHAWLKQRHDCLVAGTSAGDLLLFRGGELVARLSASPGMDRAIHSLVATSKGVVCGLDDSTVRLYGIQQAISALPPGVEEGQQEVGMDLLVMQRQIRVDSVPAAVTSIAVSPNEDVIVVSTTACQLLTFPYNPHPPATTGSSASPIIVVGAAPGGGGDDLTGGSGAASSTTGYGKPDPDVEFVVSPFHRPSDLTVLNNNVTGGAAASNGPAGNASISSQPPSLPCITGMDVCVRKPIVVSCGLDRSVRVWNYLERRCEVAKVFSEEAFSVAAHPSGFQLLVGFADKLRLLNILMDDLRVVKEFPVKACRECQFSAGGHLFAAVNGNAIQIFSLFTGELVSTLRGHNGKVRSLFWNADDSALISAGLDGAVYQWDVDEGKREAEFVQKGVPYFSALGNREGTAVFAAGGDRMLKEIEFPSAQLSRELICDGGALGQLVLARSQRLLFAGVAEPERPGSVRCFRFPLTGEASEFQCLSAPITRLRTSHDDCFLFAAGEDGALCIFEVRDKEGRPRPTAASSGTPSTGGKEESMSGGYHHGLFLNGGSSHFSEEILVTKSDLEEKNALMLELKSKVDELMLHNEYQLRLKDMTYNEQLKELTEKFTHEIEQEKAKYELLREDKNDMEMEYEDQLKQLDDRHLQRMQQLEAEAQQRIMREVEKYQDALSQREAQRVRWQSEQKKLVATHDAYVAEVADDFEQRLGDDRQLRVQLQEENAELAREYRETISQVEQDVDAEVAALARKYDDKLQAEREATLRFKGENGIMKKKFSALQKDIEDQRDTIKTLLEKEKALIEAIKALEKEIQALKREIRARDETIGEKEKRIYDLKKKNQELEKFKFVLDYKIKELKRAIEPRENEIHDMKSQIQAMDRELELFHKSNAQLDLLIGEQRARIDALQQETARLRSQRRDQRTWTKRFRFDLHAAVQFIQDPSALARAMAELFKLYVTDESKRTADAPDGAGGSDEVDADIAREYARQREYLEKSVRVLQQKAAQDAQAQQRATLHATSDNMALIREINELRGALQAARASLQTQRAAATTAGIMSGSSSSKKHRGLPDGFDGDRELKAALVQVGGDPEALVAKQRAEMEELRRVIRVLEDQMSGGSNSNSSELFPPIGRAVDG